LLQVEHQALLAAVDAEERAAFGGKRRRILAQVIALRRLDLDDLRALVGQQRAAIGRGDVAREVEDANAREGPRAGYRLRCRLRFQVVLAGLSRRCRPSCSAAGMSILRRW
jgi:hypothetical protein